MPVFVSDKDRAAAQRINADAIVARCVKCGSILTASQLITNPLTREAFCKQCWVVPIKRCEGCGELITGLAVQVSARDDEPKYAHEACTGQSLMTAGSLQRIHKQLAEIAAMPVGSLQHINFGLLTEVSQYLATIQRKASTGR